MKKIGIFTLIIISFSLGFFASKIYFKYNTKFPVPNEQTNELKSGVHKDIYFQSLRKEDNNYYIKFSKQMENKVFPDYCYKNGNFIENYDNGCVMEGRQLQEKSDPDLDLSKEYKITRNGVVELITYDSKYLTYVDLDAGTFYKYLNNLEKPWSNFYNFSSSNLSYLSFDVIVISGEIVNLREIYKE